MEAKGEYVFGTQRLSDFVSVINAGKTKDLLSDSIKASKDLLLARIPVGTASISDRPRDIAIVNNRSRAYVTLENSGRVALIDTMMLQQIDTLPETKDIVDSINLGNDASPRSIVIDSSSRYAYIADSRLGVIYVLNINPASEKYHQVVEKIQVNPAPYGLREMAISVDGRRLFVTAPSTVSANAIAQQKSQILVINIDPLDRPNNPIQNTKNWHKQIGTIEADRMVEGIAATPEANKMVFTNRQNDKKGYGVLEITNNDSKSFAATTRYASLSLGSNDDYFDVNNAISVAVTRDGKYGFVVGNNGGPFLKYGTPQEDVDGVQAGSNIGIIENPLGENPRLVAATRPIPMGLATDLVLSADDKFLYVANPNGIGVLTYDVNEITRTLNNPGAFDLDFLDRGVGSRYFGTQKIFGADVLAPPFPGSIRNASAQDLLTVPIDDINPRISVTADYGIVKEDRARNQFTYGILEKPQDPLHLTWTESNRGPIGTYVYNLAATRPDWLELDGLKFEEQPTALGGGKDPDKIPDNLKWLYRALGLTVIGGAIALGYLAWRFINNIVDSIDITDVTLTISTFPPGEGLLPEESDFVVRPLPDGLSEDKIKQVRDGVDDYNPNRVITAKWQAVNLKGKEGLGYWEIAGKRIEELVPNNKFPFMEMLNLTAGQTYYWGVKAKSQKLGEIEQYDGQFRAPIQAASNEPAPIFSSVSFITPEASAFDPDGFNKANEIAFSIVDDIDGKGTEGTVMRYVPTTGKWEIVSGDRGLGKPLVLIGDWRNDSTADKYNSGFAEGAADSMFASLVSLNQSFDSTQKDALFNSPFHFVGFGRGAVVNSEIIQRLGTYFPKPENPDDDKDPNYKNKDKFPDLQMTVVDPNDFEQSLDGRISNYFDPEIVRWENVTFADNYYQTATTFNPKGRNISNFDLSVNLGGFDESGKLLEDSRAGFTKDVKDGNNPHGGTVAWYGGTANLGWDRTNPLSYPIQRRLGDFSYPELFDKDFPDAKAWYKIEHPTFPVVVPPIEQVAQEEGIGAGWYYSVLGGGYKKRDELPSVDKSPVRVDFDNSSQARMRGDFAVPTVFNGNFDAIKEKMDDQLIPGWSLHNGSGISASDIEDDEALQKYLVDWKDIPKLGNYITRLGADPNTPNYALKLQKEDNITHNPFVLPDWGSLRFNLFVPEGVKKGGGQLKVTLQAVDGSLDALTKTILLEDVNFNTDTYGNSDINKDADRKLGYGSGNAATYGFETFTLDIPIESQLHNKAATLKFEVIGGSDNLQIYLDDVFVKSNHLRFGIPTPQANNPKAADRKEARYSIADYSTNNYKDELLIERPQYALSYNGEKNTANWASWVVNRTWIYQTGDPFKTDKRNFRPDTNLPQEFHQVPTSDYTPKPIVDGVEYATGHLVPVGDRDRPDNGNKESKNNLAISLLSNIIPQQTTHNGPGFWAKIEDYTRNFVNNSDYEVYVIAGTDGIKQLSDGSGDAEIDRSEPIKIPEHLWRVLLVLDRSNADIKRNTYTVGFWTENRNPTQEEKDWNKGENWKTSTVIKTVNEIEKLTGYDFFSNISSDIEETIENNREIFWNGIIPDNFIPNLGLSSPLMSEDVTEVKSSGIFTLRNTNSSFIPTDTTNNTAIGHNGVLENSIANTDIDGSNQVSSMHVSSFKNGIFQIGPNKVSTPEVGIRKVYSIEVNSIKVSATEVNFFQISGTQASSPEVGIAEVGSLQVSTAQLGTFQTGIPQVDISQISVVENGKSKVSTSKISPSEVSTPEINAFKVNLSKVSAFELSRPENPFPSSISLQQLLNSYPHLYTSALINTYKDNPLNLWQTLFDPTFNIDIQISDLPTGQLAEAQVTKFDQYGRPNGGTLLIDNDANGVGWFIDTTPFNNSEFSQTLTDTAFRATTGDAVGKYDLLTSILHEMGHLAGIIAGNPGFDRNVQTINGTKTFVGDNFTATLTPDGSHLDSKVHPYDLMNNTLAPGVRKLPSWLNLQMVNAIRNNTATNNNIATLSAPLSAILLAEITNGNFEETDTTKPEYGWSTRGAATILNKEAVLTEDSPFNSNFSQTFIIPEGAKYLQFTLKNTTLGASTPTAPSDAFEVALLNANSKQSLVNTVTGLTQTDSLLNIQNDGTYYTSNKVTLVNTTPNSTLTLNQPLTFKVDLTGIQAGTAATLYFDLLGFGARDAKVVLDNVMLLNNDRVAPVANNDEATINQTKPVTINILANDTDADSTINPTKIAIANNPTNGTILVNQDGTVTYTPNSTFVGTDTFTYTLTDTDGLTSNTATVNITVNNIAPVITVITGDTTTTEGAITNFNAQAVDPGDNIDYIWNFGDGSQLVIGQNATHAYADNGTYTATLTVRDSKGISSFQTLNVTVLNVAPIVNAGSNVTINEGQAIAFNGSFTDPGILDTHTISWDFGDGAIVTGILNPTHLYNSAGTYTATLTVTDNEGAVTTDTLQVQVNNVAPTITNITSDTTITEGIPANFSATATDPGNDTLTYIWNFGDGSKAIQSKDVSHVFVDNGTYTVTLTVKDTAGASTEETLTVNVNNLAPTVKAGNNLTLDEGSTANFNGTFTDPGILDTHTITWDFGDGNTTNATLTPTHIYANNGIYTAKLTVVDNSGGISTDTITVTVNNITPTINTINGDITVNEGAVANFTATATDPGNDTLTYTWNFGDGTDPIEGQSASHIFADNGNYTVTLTVTDSDGAATVQTLNTKVSNVAPTVNAGTDLTTNEGQAIAFNGNFTDPGILDTHTINWDFGDGTTATNILNPTHTYSNNGTYLVSMTVRDNAGASTTDTLTVTVNNVAPTITQLTGTTEVAEGTPANFTATATDQGLDTLTYTWNFGDGSNPVEGKNVNHTFADNGNYTVTLTVKDDEGATTNQTLNVKVNNVAATVDAGANQTMYQNEPVIFDGQFTDPGILDTHTIEWNFGDGNTATGILNPPHTYTVDGEYTVTLTITDNLGAVSNDTMTVTVKKPPTIQAGNISILEGDNGNKYAVFTASLSEASLRTVTANYSTADGTAASGSDYIATNGTITFAIGEISKTIAVQVLGDTLDEFDETFFLNLSDATNATIAKTRSVGTILDNDEAPTLAILDKTITEGDNGTQIATFTVSLSAASAKPITVKYATADGTALAGTDYTATSGAITFAPGETTKTVEVQVLGDTLDEFDETFGLNLFDPTNATIADNSGIGTIIDNDAPPVLTINDRTITEGDKGMMAVTYTVSLNTASGKPVTVDYTTVDGSATAGSDYTATNGKLTFAAGETTKTITVQVLGDSIDEFDENFGLNLNNATNATIGKASGMTTIIDNDLPPLLSINDRTITEGHNGTQTLNFTVSLSAPSQKPISVKYATANGTASSGSDYTATSGILTFAAGETTKTVSVQIIGDRLDEQNENFFVNLSEAINASIVDAQGIGTLIDDDESPTLNVAAVPGELWPPNHKMVEVKVNVNVSDDFDANPTVRLVSITSNEPDNGLGDGDTASDIEIKPDGRIFLRAERSGNGNGRIYTLTYSATDSAGNITYSTTQVRVPKNQGK